MMELAVSILASVVQVMAERRDVDEERAQQDRKLKGSYD